MTGPYALAQEKMNQSNTSSLLRHAASFGAALGCLCLLFALSDVRLSLHELVATFSPSVAFLDHPQPCEKPNYTARILSYDPLMIHLEDFITPAERKYLLEVYRPHLARSKMQLPNGSYVVTPRRTSSTAWIPADDHVSTCIASRVAETQGYDTFHNIQTLQLVSYEIGQEVRPHWDWRGGRPDLPTTFFGIIEADCENCGTRFTQLEVDWSGADQKWCRIVNCTAPTIEVLPLPGSVLFWRNNRNDGSGDLRTRHAGLPPTYGSKVGLNIWTKIDIGQNEE